MNSVKRLGMVAVLVVGVGLLASTTALADTSELLNVGDEPLATGHVSYGALKPVKIPPDIPPPYPTLYEQKITISCRSLTPGATYWTTAGTFTADRNGNGAFTTLLAALAVLNIVVVLFILMGVGWEQLLAVPSGIVERLRTKDHPRLPTRTTPLATPTVQPTLAAGVVNDPDIFDSAEQRNYQN